MRRRVQYCSAARWAVMLLHDCWELQLHRSRIRQIALDRLTGAYATK